MVFCTSFTNGQDFILQDNTPPSTQASTSFLQSLPYPTSVFKLSQLDVGKGYNNKPTRGVFYGGNLGVSQDINDYGLQFGKWSHIGAWKRNRYKLHRCKLLRICTNFNQSYSTQQSIIDSLKEKLDLFFSSNKIKDNKNIGNQKEVLNELPLLFRNHPNPFNGFTFIDYFLPLNASNAFYIPNAVSRNDDGLNDEFAPYGWKVLSYDLLIVARTGQVVYKGSSPWKPDYENGVYSYVMKVKFKDGSENTYKGHVHVIH